MVLATGERPVSASAAIQIKGRKVEQVLEGARDVFMRHGFEGASVDEIARVARVSKATLYSYFPDKRIMFLEVAKVECRRQAERSIELTAESASVREALRTIGEGIVAFITSDFGLSVFRICVAESERFPELGMQFYQSGPALVRDRVVGLMRQAIGRGELAVDDLELAADQFAELCKADIFPRIVFCRDARPDPTEVARVVDGAVDTFLARYGT
jgi:AcrR family transcriptional regulator